MSNVKKISRKAAKFGAGHRFYLLFDIYYFLFEMCYFLFFPIILYGGFIN